LYESMELGLNRKAWQERTEKQKEDERIEIAASVELAGNAVRLQVVVKVSKRESLEPNRDIVAVVRTT
jgi:hypothetical protein